MIIDFHRHVWSAFERYPSVREMGISSPTHPATTDPSAGQDLSDHEKRGDEILAEMDEAGVDLSVIFLGDYGLLLGEGSLSVEEENQRHARLVSRFPDRLVSFLGVDPRRPEAVELFEFGLERWDVRGLKLHPGSGFSPSDPECFPLFEMAGQRGVPVAVHTGPIASPLLSAGGQPLHLDAVAAQFPRTDIVMLHAGQECWWREALQIAFWKPNVHLELSGWQLTYRRDPEAFVQAVATMVGTIGGERILFASDHPAMASVMALSDWVTVFRGLEGEGQRYGQRISGADVANMLGRNAMKLLRMEVAGT